MGYIECSGTKEGISMMKSSFVLGWLPKYSDDEHASPDAMFISKWLIVGSKRNLPVAVFFAFSVCRFLGLARDVYTTDYYRRGTNGTQTNNETKNQSFAVWLTFSRVGIIVNLWNVLQLVFFSSAIFLLDYPLLLRMFLKRKRYRHLPLPKWQGPPPLIWVFGHFWLFCTMV